PRVTNWALGPGWASTAVEAKEPESKHSAARPRIPILMYSPSCTPPESACRSRHSTQVESRGRCRRLPRIRPQVRSIPWRAPRARDPPRTLSKPDGYVARTDRAPRDGQLIAILEPYALEPIREIERPTPTLIDFRE